MPQLLHKGNKVMDDIRLIIFDKDGTLIDIHHYWASIIQLRAKEFAKEDSLYHELIEAMGVDTKTLKMKPEGPVGIKPRAFIRQVVQDVLLKHGIKKEDAEIEAVFKLVDEKTKTDLKPYLKLIPGAVEFLQLAKNSNTLMAIATTDLTERANLAFQALELSDFFSDVVGADRVKASKPDAEIGLLIMKNLGVKPENCIVVGDHPVDIHLGQNCGTKTNIAVLTGLGKEEDFVGLNCVQASSLKEFSFS